MNSEVELSDTECEINNLFEAEIIGNDNEASVSTRSDNVIVQESSLSSKKRNRAMDMEEIWTVVERGRKRVAICDDEVELSRIPKERIEVCMTHKEKIPKQIGMARLL